MTKPLVFISYARSDAAEMERLCVHLRVADAYDVWVDREGLQGGAEWEAEIQKAIAAAGMAILLVTPHFLNSKFIKEVELPLILERHRRDGVLVFPVIGKPTFWKGLSWLTRFNVRPESGVPVWGDGGQYADDHLATIVEEVARLMAARGSGPPASPPPTAAAPDRSVAVVRAFDVRMPRLELFVADALGRLWVTDREQVKVFRVGQDQFVERWPLPNRAWKTCLQGLWQNHLLFADWDGSLYRFSSQRRSLEQPLYQAQGGDLPIHRLAVGPGGQLAAASWDGRVRLWDAEGRPQRPGQPEVTVPYLPTHLLPLAGGQLAAADQANYLRLYDGSGREVWSWCAQQPVRAVWAYQEADGPAFVAQLGRNRVAKIRAGDYQPEAAEFDRPIVCLAPRPGRPGDEWLAVATEGGRVDWLSVSPFRAVRENRLELARPVRDIRPVFDPRAPAGLTAVGLAADGQLFTAANEQRVEFHETGHRVQGLTLDRTHGFLFLFTGDQVLAVRNPAIPPLPPAVALESVRGGLTVGAFNRLTVRLRNTGVTAVRDIRAELSSPQMIDPAAAHQVLPSPLLPNESVDLEFSVRARAHGHDVPLDLKLELMDEGGPPGSVVELRLSAESRSP